MLSRGNRLPENATEKHLLWACLLLQTYGSEEELSGHAGGVDEQTFRTWVWDMIEAVSDLEDQVVSSTP